MDTDMTHDPFERNLEAGLAHGRAPDELYRRIAQIPLEHPRGARAGLWSRLFGRLLSAEGASWTGGLAAAAASLAIGLWLGFAGIIPDDSIEDEGLATVVYSALPISFGDTL
jgi:hypothetical protein